MLSKSILLFGLFLSAVFFSVVTNAEVKPLSLNAVKEGQTTINLKELAESYTSSAAERARIHKTLGVSPQACRAKPSHRFDEHDSLSSVERRMLTNAAKLRLSFLIEDLKKSEKPRTIKRGDLNFLAELEDCSPLSEELVTLVKLSDNWDLLDSTSNQEE